MHIPVVKGHNHFYVLFGRISLESGMFCDFGLATGSRVFTAPTFSHFVLLPMQRLLYYIFG